MTDATMRPAGDDAADRFAIHQQVLTYCRSVDRRDWAGIRSIYTADGWDHHTGFDGTADDYVAWLRKMMPALDGTQHQVTNHLCRILGDEAVSETYGQAVHWGTPGDSPHLNFTSGFRYVDHWVRGPAGWQVRERWALRDWTRNDAGRVTGTDEHRADAGAADRFADLVASLGG